ncbi:S8 family peptidase [Pseudomonas sp. B21-053]|uniref:S8 family peptidase n=1 Tax=Pseudomonas sp. B21-053 TaxID=2895493 RepID=UPI002232C01E|nr:S8 family peptidase [Pseudomonas sp. B21-053]UZE10923.1 S8 family peptidase [Pseudomonas sp. B21-053]
MEKLPLIVLNPPTKRSRVKGSPKFFSIVTPSPDRQSARLGPKFEQIRNLNLSKDVTVKVTDSSDGVYPNKAIVFELAQPKQDFKRAIEKLGLTWIDESDFSFEGDGDFRDRAKPEKKLDGRLYLTIPSQQALNQLLRLWDIYSKNKELPPGQKEWKELFSQLKDIRPWGAKDRLTNEAINFISALDEKSSSEVHLELEAVFHNNNIKDISTKKNLVQALTSLSATILDSTIIPEIRYHALLISISYDNAKKLLDLSNPILNLDEIAFIRPQAMSLPNQDSEQDDTSSIESRAQSTRPPIAALFDGVVIQNHNLLKDRLIIDDSENLESNSPVNTRSHGTAMASLILHGDLALEEETINRKLYVQFLLSASIENPTETTPKNRLLLDIIYQAVKRIKELPSELGGNVFIINISLGDINRPFSGQMSAWARLIDFLAWKYNLLFIISTGNISTPITLDAISKPAQINSFTDDEKHIAFTKAIEQKIATRSIYSPAESINSLTIGASHSDGSKHIPNAYLIDPYKISPFPSLISGLGLGYKSSVKPDILHCGGRALLSYSASTAGLSLYPGTAGKYFGQQVAGSASQSATTKIIGTSNSAALATRAAIRIYDSLESQLSTVQFSALKTHMPSLIKGLLTHTADWGVAGEFLESTLEPQSSHHWKNRRSNITRFLGYGAVDFDKVLGCTERRVTMLGTGALQKEDAQVFSFPIPTSISSRKDVRRLTITLSWLTPTKPGEQMYRDALLDFVPEDKGGYAIGVSRFSSNQPPADTSRRGTLVHEIFEGQDAIPIGDDDTLRVRVECRTQGTQALPIIPYAIIITFEVATTLKANIYNEISTKIAIQNATRIRSK